MKEKKELLQVRIPSRIMDAIDEQVNEGAFTNRTGFIVWLVKSYNDGVLNTGNTKRTPNTQPKQNKEPKTARDKALEALEKEKAKEDAQMDDGRKKCEELGGKVDETNKTCRFAVYQRTGFGHVVKMPRELGLKVIPDDMAQMALKGRTKDEWEAEWQAQAVNPDANRTPADK